MRDLSVTAIPLCNQLAQCDVLLSLQYGRPQSIRLEDCDVKPLQPSDFQNCGLNTRMVYDIQATELSVIMSRGLRKRFRLASTPESRQCSLHELDKSLAEWSLRLPETLHIKSTSSLGGLTYQSPTLVQYGTFAPPVHTAGTIDARRYRNMCHGIHPVHILANLRRR
ncbi:hypothetical protein B0H67DRAFT_121159 [Lasiosphaeris hirsuta]|uniref:Uncharacterized protein n=1 Tax=Lasiosphaeris hirsuta TaxID=260670 RepID=A0AA40E7A8_9PEZI|nr:hypothetical protein B0H67DRAFT_121159 [Lasiosphaeris hirsuta]